MNPVLEADVVINAKLTSGEILKFSAIVSTALFFFFKSFLFNVKFHLLLVFRHIFLFRM